MAKIQIKLDKKNEFSRRLTKVGGDNFFVPTPVQFEYLGILLGRLFSRKATKVEFNTIIILYISNIEISFMLNLN